MTAEFITIMIIIAVVGVLAYFFGGDVLSDFDSSFTEYHHDDNDYQNRLFQEQMDYQNQLFQDEMNCQDQIFQDEMNRQFIDYSLDESRKTVTPFEHGGYDMHHGNSFNEPSFFGGFDFGSSFHNDFNNHMDMF